MTPRTVSASGERFDSVIVRHPNHSSPYTKTLTFFVTIAVLGENWIFVKLLYPDTLLSVMTYENLDRKLVNQLLEDGRASLRSLAEELDVSVTTVSNHISELETEGIIDGYSPTIDYGALGYDVTAILQLKVEGHALVEVTEQLTEKRQVMSVYETTGDYDVIAIGRFCDTDDMNASIKALLTDPAIKESNTSVVLNPAKEHEQFELEMD
jgi:DNA-binding Lrp family transcriptional regulator